MGVAEDESAEYQQPGWSLEATASFTAKKAGNNVMKR